MKLLFDHEIFARQRYGGISRYFFELISGITKQKDIIVELFLGINSSGYDFDQSSGNLKLKGLKLPQVNRFHFLFNYFNQFLFRHFVKNSRPDIFHRTYYSDPGADTGCPNVITIHDMTHEIYPQFFARSDATAFQKKRSIETADGIICVSESTKNDLLNIHDLSDKRINVIYHGISLDSGINCSNLMKRPYILYVGQRWGYKNFNLLLTAYNCLESVRKDYDLVCFGGGGFNLSERLFIKHNNLTNKVRQVSGGDEALASLYKYASLFVYTSFYEGFGFPPLEAMKFGCPVLAASSGSVNEVAGDAALFFVPSDISDLANKLDMLLNDQKLKAILIERGRKRASLFSWEKCIKETVSFYEEILKN